MKSLNSNQQLKSIKAKDETDQIKSIKQVIKDNKRYDLQSLIDKFNGFIILKNQNKKEEKALIYENVNKLLKERQKVLNAFESKVLPIRKLKT